MQARDISSKIASFIYKKINNKHFRVILQGAYVLRNYQKICEVRRRTFLTKSVNQLHDQLLNKNTVANFVNVLYVENVFVVEAELTCRFIKKAYGTY